MRGKGLVYGMALCALCGCMANAADWSVQTINGAPRLMCDGKQVSNVMFFAARIVEGRKIELEGVTEEVKLAAAAGVKIISFGMESYHVPWGEKTKTADFKELDYTIDRILEAVPDAFLLLRLPLTDPESAERDMREKNLSADGSQDQVSIASKRYRREASDTIRATIRHLESKYGARMAGYHIGGGQHCEWQYCNFARRGNLMGYDYSTIDAFRQFLRGRYKTAAALAKAWKQPTATFETANVPTPAERLGQPEQAFLDPAIQQNAVDFNFFLNDNMADIVVKLAKVVREECGRKRLVCVFYGYLFELAAQDNGPAVSGHYALRKVLDSPDIDLISGPFTYYNSGRAPGGPQFTHTVGESITLAGKLWLNEDDTTTPIAMGRREFAAGDHRMSLDRDNAEMRQLLRRNLAFNFARNYATWWMDLHAHGWYNDPELWREKELFNPLEEFLIAHPVAYKPEVALTIDENSMEYVVSSRVPFYTLQACCGLIRDRVARSGTSTGMWLLDDAMTGRVRGAKLEIHCNAVALNANQRRQLRKHAAGVPTVWMWAPGYIDTDKPGFSLEAVEELTGFKVRDSGAKSWTTWATPDGMFYELPDMFSWGYSVSPSLSPVPQPGDLILARYRDNDAPAVVLRPAGNGRAFSVFCGTVDIPSSFIRALARQAGAHIYSSRNAGIHVNENICAITASEPGYYDLDCGGNETWVNALTREEAGNGPVLHLPMKQNETIVLCRKNMLE